MKYQALSHYKFRRLHAMLGLQSTAYTAGHLELIWAHAHQTHPDIKCADVEFIADWYGESGKLLEALIECGWLDIVDDSTVQVHDYADHAPAYVKKRDYQKEYMREYRKNKSAIEPISVSELLDAVSPNTSNVSTSLVSVSPMLDVVSVPTKHNITKPNITEEICIEDTNTLLLIEKADTTDSPKPTRGVCAGNDDAFETFWKAYPRKVGKDAARKAWKKKGCTVNLLEKMLVTLEAQRQCKQWQKEDGQFIPHPSTWLNEGRWDDEVETFGEEFNIGY